MSKHCRLIESLERRCLLSAAPLQPVSLDLKPIVLGTAGASVTQAVAVFTGAEGQVGQPQSSLPTAMVRWGDGKTDRSDPASFNASGQLVVAPSHTYSRAGVFSIVVTMQQNKKTVGRSVEKIQVLSISPGGSHLTASPGTPFSGEVGQFTANYPVILSNTVIDWGDHTTASAPDSIKLISPGQYSVSGTHTYSRPGTYRIVVSSKVGAPSVFNTDVVSAISVKKSRKKAMHFDSL